MRFGSLLLVVVGFLAVWVWPLCGCSTRSGGFAAATKIDMRELVSQQEIYFEENQTYASELETLGWMPYEGVEIEILEAGPDRWTARGTHAWFATESPYTGADCVAGGGALQTLPRTTMKDRPLSTSGGVVCDMDGWSSSQSRWKRWVWRLGD